MAEATIPFFIAATILILGFLGELVFRKTGLPSLLLLIIFGILLGPGFHIVTREQLAPVIPFIIPFALMMILFHGGLEMDLRRVLGQSGRATALAVAYFVLVTIVVTLVARFFFGFGWIQGALFGPMIAGTSSVVLIPVTQRVRIQPESGLTLVLESTITDVLNIVGFFALVELYFQGTIDVGSTIQELAARFGVGILIGFVVGITLLLTLYRLVKDLYTYILTLAVLILTFIGSEILGGSGVLAALVLGLVIGNDTHIASFMRLKADVKAFAELRNFLIRSQAELSFLVRAFFFVLLGLAYDLTPSGFLFGVTFGLLFLGMNLILRYAAVSLTTVRSTMAADNLAMTFLCGAGLAHAVLSVLPLELRLPNGEIYARIVINVIIMTNIVTSVAAISLSRGKAVPSPRPEDFGRAAAEAFGGSMQARTLGMTRALRWKEKEDARWRRKELRRIDKELRRRRKRR